MLLRVLPLRASCLRRGMARGRDGKWKAGVETMDALAQQMENAGMGAEGGADGSASFEPAQAQTLTLTLALALTRRQLAAPQVGPP